MFVNVEGASEGVDGEDDLSVRTGVPTGTRFCHRGKGSGPPKPISVMSETISLDPRSPYGIEDPVVGVPGRVRPWEMSLGVS